MGRCNQLFQDDRERQVEEYLASHPGEDESDAYDALFAKDDYEPSPQ